jgi:enoyl-CoA hydratase
MPGTGPEIDGCWHLSALPLLGKPLPETMLALTIHRNRYGPPSEALRLEQVPAPRLHGRDANRVLVAVLATGPNFNTNFASMGLPVPVFGRGDTATVHVPGSDALGLVVDAGTAVSRVKVGQAVILDSWTGHNIRGYETHDGFNAQFTIVDEERAIPVPPPLRGHTPERLAAMLLTYGTAYRAVVERLRVSPGTSVLLLGGGKGTSFAGAQIAKRLGARVILFGSNPELFRSLRERGIADAFVDRHAIPPEVFGPIPPDASYEDWLARTEPFRQAVYAANGGRPVDTIFEHTGAFNFPLLVSALTRNGALVFFGATGKGLKGEYGETFFYERRRFVFDARWVWMRQKQVLFRKGTPGSIFSEVGLLPGRKGLIWGTDAYSRGFARAALERGAELAFVASRSTEKKGIAALRRMGIPPSRVIDRDGMSLPPDMPDPLTPDGKPNPEYTRGFMRNAQALGKAYWGIFGPRQSPDFIVDRPDQSTLHYSTFILRDFDEKNAMPSGYVLIRGKTDLSLLGSHMYRADQAMEVVRLLSEGKIVMEQEDLEITGLDGLPLLQQKMLDGTMTKPKGVALVQADRAGRSIREFEDAFLGERILDADPKENRYLDVRLLGDVAVVTITRPESLNALNEELLSQLSAIIRELGSLGTIEGRTVRAVVLTGAGRAFVAGADVKEFQGKSAETIGALAGKNIAVFTELEKLPLPVIAVIDGFALGGGNELAMSTHYRIVTENASLGQPEVKLGIIPGYGGMQRLPRLVGPARAAELSANGEPVDGYTAVSWGLADEFAPSATALSVAVRRARGFGSGEMTVPRKDWDAIGTKQTDALRRYLEQEEIRNILSAPHPGPEEAKDILAARKAAARCALLAMKYGYENGFSSGLENDARAFGEITASPGGQEWVGRFLGKDPKQASFLELVPAKAK